MTLPELTCSCPDAVPRGSTRPQVGGPDYIGRYRSSDVNQLYKSLAGKYTPGPMYLGTRAGDRTLTRRMAATCTDLPVGLLKTAENAARCRHCCSLPWSAG